MIFRDSDKVFLIIILPKRFSVATRGQNFPDVLLHWFISVRYVKQILFNQPILTATKVFMSLRARMSTLHKSNPATA